MSYKQMTGNIISATKVEPDGSFNNSSASGVWSLQEQYDYVRGANWPTNGNGSFLDRILFAGGSSSNIIDYKSSTTGGNFSDFGDLPANSSGLAGAASKTRAVFGAVNNSGASSGRPVGMQYVQIATTGNSADFGTLTPGRISNAGLASDTRGIFAGGTLSSGNTDSIVYITIASTGNGTDFGNLSAARTSMRGGCGSTTRGIFAGGASDSNIMEYITIASTGNVTDFGDLSVGRTPAGASNSTRALFAGGSQYSLGKKNIVDYVEIATTGNATDFGNLTNEKQECAGSANSTHAIFGGGEDNSDDTVARRTIASLGNFGDFGNLTDGRTELAAASSVHGGLA